jgi:hypothetical protein
VKAIDGHGGARLFTRKAAPADGWAGSILEVGQAVERRA